MAWNLMKKNHLITKPASAPDVISGTDQKNIELAFSRLHDLEEHTKRLQKEMKKYIELLQNVYKLENKLSVDLSNSPVCHHNAELRKIAEDYLSVLSQVEGSIQEVIKICQKAVIEPTKKYGNYFHDIAQALHRRDQFIAEWQKASTKVAKFSNTGTMGRTASDSLKYEAAKKSLSEATRELNNINTILLSELPTFYSRCGEYFYPCLQALARAQLDYYGEMTRLFTYVLQSSTSYISTSPKGKHLDISPSSSPRKSDAEYRENINKKIAAIKALSIVKSTPKSSTQ